MTKILAHRGASKERPENTMAAFYRAEELHADGLEMDVHLLPDGTLLVRHDAALGRCEDLEGSIYAYSGADVRQIDVSKIRPEGGAAYMPEFDELLTWLTGNRLFLNVEIKTSGFLSEVGARVLKRLDAFNLRARCIISSFDHAILKSIKQERPDFAVGALYHNPYYGGDIVAYCRQHGFDAIHPHFSCVDEALVKRCHENGIAVNVWTVDDPAEMRRMLEAGVDAIISNDAATACAVAAGFGR